MQHSTIKHGRFMNKITKDPKVNSKQICIDQAIDKFKTPFLITRQTFTHYRMYGYFENVDNYVEDTKYANLHDFEIVHTICKL